MADIHDLSPQAVLRILNIERAKPLRGAYLYVWALRCGVKTNGLLSTRELYIKLRERQKGVNDILRDYLPAEGELSPLFVTMDSDGPGGGVANWDSTWLPIQHETVRRTGTDRMTKLHKHNSCTLYFGSVVPVSADILCDALTTLQTGSFGNYGTNDQIESKVMEEIAALAPSTAPSMATLYSDGCQDPVKFSAHNQSEESAMTINAPAAQAVPARRVVLVRIMDNDPALLVEHAHVFDSGAIVTESDDQTTIMQALADYDINAEVARHNAIRATLTDETILRTTGQDVNLRPIKLKDLTITVVRV